MAKTKVREVVVSEETKAVIDKAAQLHIKLSQVEDELSPLLDQLRSLGNSLIKKDKDEKSIKLVSDTTSVMVVSKHQYSIGKKINSLKDRLHNVWSSLFEEKINYSMSEASYRLLKKICNDVEVNIDDHVQKNVKLSVTDNYENEKKNLSADIVNNLDSYVVKYKSSIKF